MTATEQVFDANDTPVVMRAYNILGLSLVVISNLEEALARVHNTYATFAILPHQVNKSIIVSLLEQRDGSFEVTTNDYSRNWPTFDIALLDLLDVVVHIILRQLLDRGLFAIHAGAVVRQDRALGIVGRSGQGKTTLTLGLLQAGFTLLSDELLIAEPEQGVVLPYRHSLHVRPGTLDIVPAMQFLRDRPRYNLGGGSEWALTVSELEKQFPGSLAQQAPLRHLIFLEGQPRSDGQPKLEAISSAKAALELLKNAWAASVDFARALNVVSNLLEHVQCATLEVGKFERTIELISRWQGQNND